MARDLLYLGHRFVWLFFAFRSRITTQKKDWRISLCEGIVTNPAATSGLQK